MLQSVSAARRHTSLTVLFGSSPNGLQRLALQLAGHTVMLTAKSGKEGP